ncbi:MAG: S-adenosylmethionine transporter [Icmadophila ericetorum]|nr:S-adenosylmethionine transporter [Icmadophila ericetorum]
MTSVPTFQLESPFTRALFAGALAGTTVDLTLYPIDTLKTRLQSPLSFQASGGFRGIYAGVGSALAGSAPSAALFFVTYEYTKSLLRKSREEGGGQIVARTDHWTEPVQHMLAASAGEVVACAVRVPTEVIKQRAQAVQYKSSMAALQGILSQKGQVGFGGVWREMYRGWNVTVMREVPFTIIQFPLWEALKEWRRRKEGREAISGAESAVFGSIAGAVAAGITTPLDVLKTRLMLSRERIGSITILREILRTSGPRAFFAGIGPRIMWISAGGAIFLGSYQGAYNTLQDNYGG